MKVFVAGATGALGRPVVAKLIAAGHTVTGIARSAERARSLERAGAHAAEVDLFDAAAVADAVAGHDVVCNLATNMPVGTKAARAAAWAENNRIRAEGSKILTHAAVAAGAMRFVQEAVTLIYADGGQDWVTEHSPTAPTRTLLSSLIATEAAQRFGSEGRFGVVLRFGSFYGDDRRTRWNLETVRAGRPMVPGTPNGYFAPIHIDDAASAVVASLGAPSGIYNVAAEPVPRSEYARILGEAAGTGEPAKFLPTLVQRGMGWRVTPLARSLRISSDAFRRSTGWSPRIPFHEGWPQL